MPKLAASKSETVYVGADPGEKGGFAAIDGVRGELIDTFGFGNRSEVDMKDWLNAIVCSYELGRVVACLELVRASPQQGVTSAFTFGWNYGFLRGLILGLGLPLYECRPQEWQGKFCIPKKRPDEEHRDFKKRIRSICQERFRQPTPNLITLETCDAVFLAAWLRLHQLGAR